MCITLPAEMVALIKKIEPILKDIKDQGGTPYLVGGSVRDLILQKPIKDFDVEVHGLSYESLHYILSNHGFVEEIGKKFGVLMLIGLPIDWSLPRKDSVGRKPIVYVDHLMGIKDALRRRDITMNAMALNLCMLLPLKKSPISLDKRTIIDPYHGKKDIQDRIIRAVDERLFTDDPLRLFRVMQFTARFEMTPDENLDKICSQMDLYDTSLNKPLAPERIIEEIKKMFLQSKRPSLGFRWLLKISRLTKIFPVFQHANDLHESFDLLDWGAKQEGWYRSEEEKFILLVALVFHASLTAAGHFKTSELVKDLSLVIKSKKEMHGVSTLLQHFKQAEILNGQPYEARAYKFLAASLFPHASIRHLAIMLACKYKKQTFQEVPLFYWAVKAGVHERPEEPLLQGKDLCKYEQPGPKLGALIQQVYDWQLRFNIKDRLELERLVKEYVANPHNFFTRYED